MQHVTAPELAAWLGDSTRPRPLLLDVRENWEFETCHIDGSTLIAMNTIPFFMTKRTSRSASIDCSGLPGTAMRSAHSPVLIGPRVRSSSVTR